MSTQRRRQEIEKLQAKLKEKHKNYLKHQKEINDATHNPNRGSDTLNLQKLLNERTELLRLSKKYNDLVKEYPHDDLGSKMTDLLTEVGKTLVKEPVKKERLTYTDNRGHKTDVLRSYGSLENKKIDKECTDFSEDVKKHTKEIVGQKYVNGPAVNMVNMYSDNKKLLEEYNELKPRFSGFPLSGFNGKKSTAEPPTRELIEISKELEMIKANIPQKLDRRYGKIVPDEKLLAHYIRGCLLQHIENTPDKTLKKTLTSLLKDAKTEEIIGEKTENQDNIKKFQAFKEKVAPTVSSAPTKLSHQ